MRNAICVCLVLLIGCATAGFRDSMPDARGFSYMEMENDHGKVETLTNPAAIDLTPQPKRTGSVLVGYKRITDRAAGTTRTYKTEVRRSGNDATLVVTDVASGETVLSSRFPEAAAHAERETFDTIAACINDFLCKNSSALQCEANKTCRDQFWSLICCLKNGSCVSVHGVIHPNTLRCQVIGQVTDFEAVIFSRD